MDEKLSIFHATTVLPGGVAAFACAPVTAPNGITVSDRFETRNDFYGGQVGARGQLYWHRFFVGIEGKLAVGSNHEGLSANGSSSLVSPAGTVAALPGRPLAAACSNGLNR